MLDRVKLSQSLEKNAQKLFPPIENSLLHAVEVWRHACRDTSFPQWISQVDYSFLVPSWHDSLGKCIPLSVPQPFHYSVLAVDGSQIYPDRNVGGAGCFLINTGAVELCYNHQSSVAFASEPHLLFSQDLFHEANQQVSRDMVDGLREAYELEELARRALDLKEKGSELIALIDGTIIFWMLEGKAPEVKDVFLQRYFAAMNKLYYAGVLYAGYISFPKGRELMNVVRIAASSYPTSYCDLCQKPHLNFEVKHLDTLLDSHLIDAILPMHQRTIAFSSASLIIQSYPSHLAPYFCYIATAYEVVRVEVPAWIAHNDELLDYVCKVVCDQVEKGRGYPVVLAEAHEQAVIKNADREFFYHLLQKIGLGSDRALRRSQKSMKKRGIGI